MKQIYKYIGLSFLTVLVVVFFMRKCSNSEIPNLNNPLKERVVYLKADQKKLKDSIVYKEVVRTKYLVMWKEVRHDSLIPCETKLLVCDTIIRADSAVIVAQALVIKKSDVIIATQDSVIKMDSIALKSNKKFWRGFKIGFATGAILGTGTNLIGG